ncbi:GH3 auxin-responsive promoter family protein [bacterium]|nr:GH3 auxin-responsive promoter family protein [bacterium]
MVADAPISQGLLHAWAAWTDIRLGWRLGRYRANQAALSRRYRLAGKAPRRYDERVRASVVAAAAACREPSAFAWTSGTTASPKQIHYPLRRLRQLRQTFIEQAVLAWAHYGGGPPAFYFPASAGDERSLTGLLAQIGLPEHLRRLVLPLSPLPGPNLAALSSRCSPLALHTFLLAIASPTLVATPNPSTLYVLLERLRTEWDSVRAEWEGLLATAEADAVIGSLGAAAKGRVAAVARWSRSGCPPPLGDLLPRLRVVSCWDGGYVQPFLRNLQDLLFDLDIAFHPLFSLSTETVETEVYPGRSEEGGLPVHPGVRYEFAHEREELAASDLIDPWDLAEGERYLMVVSDAYGLCRYETRDIFSCHGFVGPAPVLRFVGRAGIGYSFTGEKITAEQVLQAFEALRSRPGLGELALTCFPLLNPGGLPGYVIVACQARDDTPPPDWLGKAFDRQLAEQNEEYAAKRTTGRLAKPRVVAMAYGDLVALLERRWDAPGGTPAQFKLLPLYPTPWERIADG